MRKIYILLSIVALLSITSCQKDKLTGSSFTATIEKCTDIYTKTVLSGTSLHWEAGDQIIIFNDFLQTGIYTAASGGNTTTTFTYVETGNGMIDVGDDANYNEDNRPSGYYAIYPADIMFMEVTPEATLGGITIPAVQQTTDGSLHGFPMYAESATKALSFKNILGLLKFTLQKDNTTITSISVTADHEINGKYYAQPNWPITGNVPALTYANSGTTTTTLRCGTGNGISIATSKDFYIYLPAGEYSSLTINITNSDGGFCTLTANTTIPVVRSQYTTIELRGTDMAFAEIAGLFSVGPNQYVQFSPGNLQYKPSTQEWRFASSQLEMIGEENYNYFVNGTNNSGGWIDLFSWGEETPTRNITDYNADGYTTFYEWGDNFTNEGWYTLDAEQWLYLIGGRPNAQNLYGGATIDGVKGLILLPDSWSLPSGITFTPGFAYSDFYNTNTYTAAQALTMQNAGAVFLPAAGAMMGVIMTQEEQQVIEWYYSYTFPDFENWDDYSGLAGIGPAIAHGLYLIVRDANLYWTATPYSGEVIADNSVNQAYGAAFSTVPGVTQDPTGGDIYGFPDDIWRLHPEIEGNTQRIELFEIFNNPDFYFIRGQYVFGVPIPTFAKGAVRLVRDVTPGTQNSKK